MKITITFNNETKYVETDVTRKDLNINPELGVVQIATKDHTLIFNFSNIKYIEIA